MAFVGFFSLFARERRALGYMVCVSHLSHSSASVRRLFLTLAMTSLPAYLSAPLHSLLLMLNSPDPRPRLQHLYTFSVSHTLSTFLSHRLMASQTPRCLRPLSSVCFIPSWLPDYLSPSLPLATACWIKHRCSLSLSKSADYIKSAFTSLYPITDGSSKLIQDLSRTNVTPCFGLKQMGPRASLTDTSTTWTHEETVFVIACCSLKTMINRQCCAHNKLKRKKRIKNLE